MRSPLRKAVVFDKSGTTVDPCRVVLGLRTGTCYYHISTLAYVRDRRSALVNVRGPFSAIMNGDVKRRRLKVSCSALPPEVEKAIGPDLLTGDVMEGLRAAAEKVRCHCGSDLGICTALVVDPEGRVSDIVGLGGRLYDEVPGAIRSIIASGADVFLATGNCEESSLKCGKALGVRREFIVFDASPRDKCKLVRKLRGFYGSVIMVGNDINDLPAMREADVAIIVNRDGGGCDLGPEVDYVVPSLREVERIVARIDSA